MLNKNKKNKTKGVELRNEVSRKRYVDNKNKKNKK